MTTYEIFEADTFALTVDATSPEQALDLALADAPWNDHPAGEYVIVAHNVEDPTDTAGRVITIASPTAILELRTEAAAAGDTEMVTLCTSALAGNDRAIIECSNAIAAAVEEVAS